MESRFLRVLFFLLSLLLAELFVLLSKSFVTLDVNCQRLDSSSRASALLRAATAVQLAPPILSRASLVPVARCVPKCSRGTCVLALLRLLFKLAELGVRAGFASVRNSLFLEDRDCEPAPGTRLCPPPDRYPLFSHRQVLPCRHFHKRWTLTTGANCCDRASYRVAIIYGPEVSMYVREGKLQPKHKHNLHGSRSPPPASRHAVHNPAVVTPAPQINGQDDIWSSLGAQQQTPKPLTMLTIRAAASSVPGPNLVGSTASRSLRMCSLNHAAISQLHKHLSRCSEPHQWARLRHLVPRLKLLRTAVERSNWSQASRACCLVGYLRRGTIANPIAQDSRPTFRSPNGRNTRWP